MRDDLKQFIKDVRAAQRRAELQAGTLLRNRASTIPDAKKQYNKTAARYRSGARKRDEDG